MLALNLEKQLELGAQHAWTLAAARDGTSYDHAPQFRAILTEVKAGESSLCQIVLVPNLCVEQCSAGDYSCTAIASATCYSRRGLTPLLSRLIPGLGSAVGEV